MNSPSRQKINKEAVAWNDTLGEMDLTSIQKQQDTQYAFFSNRRGTLSRTDYMLGHKTSVNNYKKTEIRSSMFSDHNIMELEINYKKKTGKFISTWRLKHMLLDNQWVKEEIKRNQKYLETNGNGNTTYQNLLDAEKTVRREKFIGINAYTKKQERSQINNLTLYLKT